MECKGRQGIHRIDRVYVNPDRVYVNPDRIHVNPDRIYVNPDRVYSYPDRIYVNPNQRKLLLSLILTSPLARGECAEAGVTVSVRSASANQAGLAKLATARFKPFWKIGRCMSMSTL